MSASAQHAEQANARLSQTLDRVDTGVIIVDQAARVLFANHQAETLLAEGCGMHLDGHELPPPIPPSPVLSVC
ncbi:MAG: PAS domain-containing protein [Methyloceanibacter sp.]